MSRQVGRPRQTLTGARFGRLTVEGPAPDRQRRDRTTPAWWCLCDCGERVSVAAQDLRSEGTRSCGCLRGSPRRRPVPVGEKFGRLTVEGPAPDFADKGGHNVAWQMRCHCGASFVARAHNIKRYHTRSCGCARRAS